MECAGRSDTMGANKPLTSFPSAALPGNKDALVLVLVSQRAVGLVCQGVTGEEDREF